MNNNCMFYQLPPPPHRYDSHSVDKWFQKRLVIPRVVSFSSFDFREREREKKKTYIYVCVCKDMFMTMIAKKKYDMSRASNNNEVPPVSYESMEIAGADVRR